MDSQLNMASPYSLLNLYNVEFTINNKFKNSLHFFVVIPAKAGIQFNPKMDARLKTSGMTKKGLKA
jgi:hypothetical protein